MKRVIPVIALLLVVATVAFTQTYRPGWAHAGVFPPPGKAEKDVGNKDTLHSSTIHGLAVSPDGRVWIQNYYAYGRDSILVNNYRFKSNPDSLGSRYVIVRKLYAYNPDGTPAPFSPILTAKGFGTKIDTMGGEAAASATGPLDYWTANSGVGLRADIDGNILAGYWSYLYRINYKTGAGMGKVNAGLQSGAGKNIVSVGVDKDGNIFSNPVVPPGPIKIYDKDFNFIGNAVDSARGYSRSLEVSKDGNDVYYMPYDKSAIYLYHSDNGILGPYAKCDTILKGIVSESVTWHPKTGHLWFSGGSYTNKPNGWWDKSVPQRWSPNVWYAYDPVSKTIKDSLTWVFGIPNNANERPRAIAFTPTGDTVYVGVFGATGAPGVRRYIYSPTAVYIEREEGSIPTGYALSQNYPNPFNPSTQIRFTIGQAGMTTLRVFDMMGREVTTLVNQALNPGAYSVTLDAKDLSSGTYVYVLTSGSARLANKMVLVK